jgi:hypothetical protein
MISKGAFCMDGIKKVYVIQAHVKAGGARAGRQAFYEPGTKVCI